MSTLPVGVYQTVDTPWWLVDISGTPANILASTLTINSVPNGNITLTHNISSGTEYNAPLIFQRPPADINAPSESLVMNTSIGVPTKPVDGEYITATKTAGTVYDDIAVAGLQVYGNQTTAGNAGAVAYITGNSGNLILAPQDSVYVSSLFVSTLTATNVVSTTATTGTSLTLTSFLSSASVTTGIISTNSISTSQIVSKDIFTSTLAVSSLNAPNFVVSTISSTVIDTKVTLTSTLTLLGVSSVNLGLGDVIQGLVGGAATQALGVGIGGAALITGTVALATGRTSGGVNPNVFQTINGSTQLQFSTIGQAVSSVFLTVNSPNPLTTPGLEISTTQGVAAGTYCVRSVGDPLYITNNVSSIQMYGQWVPVIQPTATVPALGISSLTVSSINGLPPGGGGGGGITSTIAISTATINGNLTQSGTGTFNWGGNTMSPTQVVLNRATAINNTLTTSGTAFLNAGATVNAGLVVASGGMNVSGFTSLTGGASVTNGLTIASGTTTFGGQVNMNQNASVFGALTVNNGSLLYGSVILPNGSLAVQQFGASVNASILSAGLTMRSPALSTINISTANINVSSVNGAVYPPGGGGGIPSTLNASTLTVNGGQTITNGALIVVSGGISVVTDGINVGAGNVLIQDAISVNGLATLNGGVRTSAISTNTISSASLFISSINGAVYPPPVSGGIPSTLNASTINVNGGINIANGGIVNNSFEPIKTGFLSTNQISTGLITVSTIQAPTVQASFVSSGTITANNIGCFQISSLTGSIYTLLVDGGSAGRQGLVFMDALSGGNNPYGNTKAVGNGITTFLDPVTTSYNIQNGYTLGLNRIVTFYGQNSGGLAGTAQFFSTLTVCANPPTSGTESCIQTYPPTAPAPVGTVISKAISTQTIQVSSINGVQVPGTLGLPTGTVMLWGGTSEVDPPGFYICDGRALSIAANPALYAVIGLSYYNNYPNVIAPGTFLLPDLTFAIPQGAPKANYAASFTAGPNIRPGPLVNYMSNVPGVTTNDTQNRVWLISAIGAGTINVGTLIPGGQYAGQTANLYIQSIVQTDSVTGLPSIIAVQSVDGTPVVILPGNTNINCSGVYRQPLAPLIQNYWAAGTFNELAFTNPGSNGPAAEPPSKRNVRTQQGVEVGVHTHTYIKYGQFGSTGLVNGEQEPSKGNFSPQTGNPTQNITDSLGNTWAAPYPTKPNVINMFYIIKA